MTEAAVEKKKEAGVGAWVLVIGAGLLIGVGVTNCSNSAANVSNDCLGVQRDGPGGWDKAYNICNFPVNSIVCTGDSPDKLSCRRPALYRPGETFAKMPGANASFWDKMGGPGHVRVIACKKAMPKTDGTCS